VAGSAAGDTPKKILAASLQESHLSFADMMDVEDFPHLPPPKTLGTKTTKK